MENFPTEFLIITFVAMLAPLLAEIPKSFRLPIIAVEIILGIIIGPHILGLSKPIGIVAILGDLGLTFLLFMVGLEIDFDKIRGRPLSLAISGWFLSLVVAIVSMSFFNFIGLIQAPPLLTAVALSTTALGVLTPILRDRGELDSSFGTYMLAAAAMGELGPLLVISMLIIPTQSTMTNILSIATLIIVALIVANLALYLRSAKGIAILTHTTQSSGQLPVRICLLMQIFLVTLAEKFGLNIVIGAFVAGIVVKATIKGSKNSEENLMKNKLDAIGYGFLIPVFFIVSGMKFEINALWSAPLAPIQIILLSSLLLFVRGIPLFLYRSELSREEKLPFAFYSATGLPLIVVISEIGLSSGLMSSDKASILVSAGMLSVLLFPILADKVRTRYVWPW